MKAALNFVIGLTCFLFLTPKTQAEPTVIRLGVYDIHLQELLDFTQSSPCPSITQAELNNHHVLADYLIFCNAIKLAPPAFEYKFEFVGYPIFQRALADIYKGEIMAATFTFWHKDIDEQKAYISPDIVVNGQYAKGIYTSKSSHSLLQVTDENELKKYPAITNLNWQKDVEQLTCLNVKMYHADSLQDILRLTMFQRDSFMLQMFTNANDLSQTYREMTIYPVPGFKVIFNDSLNFAISKQTKNGKQLYSALVDGIARLRKDKLIYSTYERVGLFNPVVKNWKNIGCQ